MKKLLSLLVVAGSVTMGAWGCGGRGEPVDNYEPPAPPPPPGMPAPAEPGSETPPGGETPPAPSGGG